MGVAPGGRAGLQRRMARAGGEALRRPAHDHLVRQPGHRRQSRSAARSPRRRNSTKDFHDHAHPTTTSRPPPSWPPPVGLPLASSGAALAPSAARTKGPKVWLDMDQQELDDAYDQIVYAPNRDQVGQAPPRQHRAHARHPRQAASASPTGRPRSSTSTSIAPRNPTRRSTSTCTAAPGAPTGPPTTPSWPSRSSTRARTSSCSTSSMSTTPAAACFRWSSRCGARSAGSTSNAQNFGGDPDRLYLCSHSSGSHLGGCVVTTDWRKEGLPRRHPQGRNAEQRHVRSQAGAALQALEIRQVHRRDGSRS